MYKQDYMTHKRNAKKRNIDFFLSYEEWLDIWTKSGHLNNRGRGKGKYHMCRYNDVGPYAIGNVYIDTAENNAGLPHKGVEKPLITKFKMSIAQKGKSKSISAVQNNAIAQLHRPKYDCPHCQINISGLGNLKQHVYAKHREFT